MYNVKNSIEIIKGDITTLNVDCIVNAANNSLLGGGGVDGAIHRAAGAGLLAECRTLGGCETGKAKITRGYDLKAKWVVHTVGPIYKGSTRDDPVLLNCYINSLELAAAHGVRSIAFPAISAGAYGYPLDRAAQLAVCGVITWLTVHPDCGMNVKLCCFDDAAYCVFLEAYDGELKGRCNDGSYVPLYTEMRLAPEPFQNIKGGEKTVEIRLYDEKRRRLKLGDTIIFTNTENDSECFAATVTALRRFDNFKAMFSSELFAQTGCVDMTVERAVESMYVYYTKEQENRYGVLAISVKKI